MVEELFLPHPSALFHAGITDPGYNADAKGGCSAQQRDVRGTHVHRLFVSWILWVLLAAATRAEPPSYLVFVSNERSGDVTVIDGATDNVVGSFPVGKRPRGIHATTDGRRVFVTLSGSPRMAPGLDENRAPADERADGLGVIDPATRKLIHRWHVGSDPEQFAISKDGKFAFIANEDDASVSIVDLDSGQSRDSIKVSEEPEGVGVNLSTGEVYVTCEEKGEVFAINPGQQRLIATIETGGRPRSVAFSNDGSRAYVACENGGYVRWSMRENINYWQRFNCRQPRCQWAPWFRLMKKTFTSQLAAATP